MKPLRAATLTITTMLGLLGVTVVVVSLAQRARTELPVINQVTPFKLTERSGAPFTHLDLTGRLHIVDFIFTDCPDACILMGSKMSGLYKAFEGDDRVRLVSISVDPEKDTLEVLQNYARSLGVTDERWLFLRGPIEEVAELSEKGFFLGAQEFPRGHSTRLVLVDEKGQVRGYYDGLDDASVKQLKTDIRNLVLAS